MLALLITTLGLLLQPAPEAAPKPAGATAPVMKILSSGNGDRRVLRLALAAGAQHRSEIDIQTSSGPAGIEAARTEMPTTRLTYETTVERLETDGDALLSIRVVDARLEGKGNVEADVLERLKAGAAELVGLTGSTIIAPTGGARGTTVTPASGKQAEARMVESIRAAIDASGLILPDAPVGIGATWSVSESSQRAGAIVTQTSDYKLESLSKDGFTIAVTTRLSAPPQEFSAASGLSGKLESLSGSGRARATWRFDTPTATSATASSTVTTTGEVRIEGRLTPFADEWRQTTEITTSPVRK
jgi:hypothetical protein